MIELVDALKLVIISTPIIQILGLLYTSGRFADIDCAIERVKSLCIHQREVANPRYHGGTNELRRVLQARFPHLSGDGICRMVDKIDGMAWARSTNEDKEDKPYDRR